MHIVELSTAGVKVDIKVINASLTQNLCLQCVTPPLTLVEIPRDATELNNDGMIIDQVGRRQLRNRTEFINISERDLVVDDSSFCSHILLAVDLQCHVFHVEKFLLNVRLCL